MVASRAPAELLQWIPQLSIAERDRRWARLRRKKLLAKINRVAENLGIDENFAAAVRAHLKATGQIRGDEPAEAEGQGANLAGAPEFMGEAAAPEFMPEAGAPAGPPAADHPGAGFFYSNWP